MGWLTDVGLASINPVALFANAGAGALDYWAAEEDRKSAEAQNRAAGQLTRDQMAMQREFAQNGIRWRVDDAVAAGLHPLAALGSTGASYSPVSSVFTPTPSSAGNAARAISGFGQNISRAMMSTATAQERELHALQLDRARIENDLAREQLIGSRMANQKMMGPPLPSNSEMGGLTGQGSFGRTAHGGSYVVENPLQRTHSQPGRPAQEVGAVADYAFARTPKGYAVVPSTDVKQKIEDTFIPETLWALRNQLMPSKFIWGLPPPDPRYYKLPPGYSSWKWNPFVQEFRPSKERHFKKQN